MADNTPVTPGTGVTLSTDDIGGVQVQRVKVQFGADGSATDVSSGAALPVAQTGALPAGANNVGKVDVNAHPVGSIAGATSIPAGANNIGSVNVAALPATPTGTNVIGHILVDSLPALPTGANAIGTVGVTALPALPTGANAIGSVGITSLAGITTTANPHAVSQWNVSTTADNANAVANKAAVGGQSHYVTAISASYSVAKIALLTLLDGATNIGNWYVNTAFSITFPKPLKLTANQTITLTLAASGTGGQIGAVTLSGYTV